jgi:mannose-1-phosphate guanylyltransferase / mannose-6-phosphate isomerase
MPTLVPLILSGGSGKRLWPMSRETYPKQLLALARADRSLLQSTVERLAGLAAMADAADAASLTLAPPIVVCNEAHRFVVAEQLRGVGVERATILLEPVGRNTAPAAAVGCHAALEQYPDALVLVLPADHVIADPAVFCAAVAAAMGVAQAGALVTFGITPTAPSTGYGYIRVDADAARTGGALPVREFLEKPDAERARRCLASGDYHWNSGIFLFAANSYLAALERHAPAIARAAGQAFADARRDLDFIRLDSEAMAACPANSIDYAVMEHAERVCMVPLAVAWSDVGAWDALQAIGEADADGNVVTGDVLGHENHGSYLRAESRLLAVLGVTDLVVVETADAVLVAARHRAQDVQLLVERLRLAQRSEASVHRRVRRPWGAYEGVASGDRFQVKRIVVEPGASLSLQLHHHRAEHWIVVRGTARVTRGDETLLLSEDQSTYIPLGTPHRLENPGVIPLELIEVQSGSYLGEDDIVRFDDVYGRC